MNNSFAERWNRKLTECGYEDLYTPLISIADAALPKVAAPCLDFNLAAGPMPIWEVYGHPSQWSADERDRLAAFLMIGSDGADNPICIEQPVGSVVLLDHEDHFRTRTFVNSSVSQLSECVLAYMGERDSAKFQRTVEELDPAAMAKNSFWWHEANCIDPTA